MQSKPNSSEVKTMGDEIVHCPECGTTTSKEDIEDAIDVAENHDEARHDGEPTAKVNGIRPPQFTEEQKEKIQEAVDKLAEVSDEE